METETVGKSKKLYILLFVMALFLIFEQGALHFYFLFILALHAGLTNARGGL